MSSTTSSVLFAPADGWVGDVIPFRRDGRFWLFYLLEVRSHPRQGTPWALVSTEDFVHFVDHGVVLPAGGSDDQDFNAYTGSVVMDGETAHLFYTGQNPDRHGADGKPVQLVMHATSADGLTSWRKHPEHVVSPPAGYETADWRDPFVFSDGAVPPVWRMLVTARHDTGPERRRGTIAQLTSTDLVHWQPAEPFWDPRRYIAHECPDVFRMGEWWYLVYSEFSESFTTRYRMARSVDGPWLVPELDTIDGRAFYAAKSVAAGDRRFLCGWIATKEGERDDGAYEWAGTLSILEASQRPDGTLRFTLPRVLASTFVHPCPTRLGGTQRLTAPDGFDVRVDEAYLPSSCRVTARVEWDGPIKECGLVLRTDGNGEVGYHLRLEPQRGRVVLDRWPRRRTGREQWQISGDVPHAVELERPCPLPPGEHTIELLLDDTLLVAIVDDAVALSARLYDHHRGRLGIFVGEGQVRVREVTVSMQQGHAREEATPGPTDPE